MFIVKNFFFNIYP